MGPRSKPDNDNETRVPRPLTITDIGTVISVALVLIGGWGVLSSRIAVLEAGQVEITKNQDRATGDIKDIRQSISDTNKRLDDHISRSLR